MAKRPKKKARKSSKSRKRLKTNISSKKSLDVMLKHMRSGGSVPKFDPFTGKKLTGHGQTALINADFLRGR